VNKIHHRTKLIEVCLCVLKKKIKLSLKKGWNKKKKSETLDKYTFFSARDVGEKNNNNKKKIKARVNK